VPVPAGAPAHVLAIADALRARLPTGLLTNNGPVLLDILPAALPEVALRFGRCS
jgi:hypothetical protein